VSAVVSSIVTGSSCAIASIMYVGNALILAESAPYAWAARVRRSCTDCTGSPAAFMAAPSRTRNV
jgi:hypothetical protein